MKLSKSKALFLFLSIAIALIDSIFVITNHFYTKQSFKNTLQENSQKDYAIYQTVLESTYTGLSMQATVFAGDKRIQDLFLKGKKSLEKEGGTRGGKETAKIRHELYQIVAKAWQDATQKFDVRQLHFHLGPGSYTFLRVHKPEKFGDRMDNLRFIIVDTNEEQTPRNGFETGRVYSGLRSVVPVFAHDDELNKKVYVGALEVGTSYKKLLQTIDKNLNLNISILLNNQHIKNTVWDEFLTGQYNNNTINNCDCILEASSRSGNEHFLSSVVKDLNSNEQLTHADQLSRIIEYNSLYYSITFHPLRDYLGEKNPSRHNIGAVFIAKDITQSMMTYQEEQTVNILYGIAAYIIIELLLLLTFYKVTQHLTSRVKLQTKELTEQKKIIEQDKIKYKNLADAINSNYFFYSRTRHNEFKFVSPSVTRVLGYSKEEFLENPIQYLPENAHAEFVLEKAKQTFIDKDQNTFEVEIYNKNNRLKYLLVTETPKQGEGEKLTEIDGLAQDITQARQDKMLLQLHCRIIKLISEKIPFDVILNELAFGIESIIQDVKCAIMIVNQKTNQLELASSPRLPENFKNILRCLDIDSQNAFCCTAVTSAKRKIISDMSTDPFWQSHSDILKSTSFKACSSEPILTSEANVIATIDFYYETNCSPNESDVTVLATSTNLISVLFDHHTHYAK